MHEDVKIIGVSVTNSSSETVNFAFENDGSYTCHLVALWIDNVTLHQRYDMSLYINAGDNASYSRTDVSLPAKPYTVKVITERGNVAVYGSN